MSNRLSAIALRAIAPSTIALAAVALTAIVATALLPAGAAHATVVEPLSERQLAERADRIVVGRCIATESRWLDRVLVTAVTVEVTDTLKGDAAERVTLLLPGGIDFDRPVPVQMTFPGAPRVVPGEELFLFLSSAEDLDRGAFERPYRVTGYAQGKLEIARDAGGRPVVRRTGQTSRSSAAVPLAEYQATIRGFLGDDSEPEGRVK